MLCLPRFNLNLTFKDLLRLWGSFFAPGQEEDLTQFEKEFAAFIGTESAFFLPSARSCLVLLLKTLAPAQKTVLLSAFNHPSVPAAVMAAGLTPHFIDIDLKTYSLSPQELSPEILKQAGVLVLPHLYGCPGPLKESLQLKEKYAIYLIEDCAQSLGAEYQGKKTGSFGDAAIFSFALTKNFTTLGGGMITTSDKNLAEKLKIKLAALKSKTSFKLLFELSLAAAMKAATNRAIFSLTVYPFLMAGYFLRQKDLLHPLFAERISPAKLGEPKFRPPKIKARLGLRQLKDLEAKNKIRAENAKRLLSLLADTPGISLPFIPPETWHIFLSLVIRSAKKEKLAALLLKKGIDTSPGYLACLAEPKADFPKAQKLESEQLHLPVYPELSLREIERIAVSLKEAVKEL